MVASPTAFRASPIITTLQVERKVSKGLQMELLTWQLRLKTHSCS